MEIGPKTRYVDVPYQGFVISVAKAYTKRFQAPNLETMGERCFLKKAGRGLALVAGLWGMIALPATAQEQRFVELELVLAIDTSTSVNAFEFHLQRQGIADAFRHPTVIDAIRAVGGEGIAVTVVQWSGANKHETSVDWTVIRNRFEAEKFAAAVDASERRLRGLTDIGGAIRYSMQKMNTNNLNGLRRVIDISGDGTSGGGSLAAERKRAVGQGVIINGLVILEPDPELWEFGLIDHYEYEVIGGPGAFLMTAKSFEDFADAIRRKLIREIIGFNLASAPDEAEDGILQIAGEGQTLSR